MKICYLNGAPWLEALGEELIERGHEVSPDCTPEIELVLGMSISQMQNIQRAHDMFPGIPMINYNWDIYNWVFTQPREGEYNYKQYMKLLNESVEVWVPSETEKRRSDAQEINNVRVIKTYSLYFPLKSKDRRYVFNAMRELPDEEWDWAEKACAELGFPYVGSDRNRTWEQYLKVLAHCRLMISPNKEASTGGLSLIEGYYNGKPLLINGGGGNGGVDYFGSRAETFSGYNDLKKKLESLWDNLPKPDLVECRAWVEKNYSVGRMADEVEVRLCELLS